MGGGGLDGLPELILPIYSHEHANSGFISYTAWTRKGARLEAYAPAKNLPIVGFTDGDGDGRLDLVLTDGSGLDQSGVDSSRREETWSLAHSLKDGTFSTTDEVAKAFKSK